MYVCVCACMCIYIYAHTHTYMTETYCVHMFSESGYILAIR